MKDNMAQKQKLPFAPSDELQIYYNDAYMKERERFNNIFGVIDNDALAQNQVETVYIEPSPEEYVTMKQYKKTKKSLGIFIVSTILFAGAAVFFLLKTLSVF